MSIELFYAEVANAKELLHHFSQLMYFCQDYSTLKSGKTLSKSSSLHSLNPFIDQSNLIRVGGRLGNSKLDFFTKYPIVLHKACPIVNLLIRQIHIDHEHASPNLMMSILSERFYIVGAKSIVRKISRNCSMCQRVYSHSMQQQMGNLPINRTNITPPFVSTGVDMAGPFYVKQGSPRKPTILKSYVALFVCMATKSVHLELVCDLSTGSFQLHFTDFQPDVECQQK